MEFEDLKLGNEYPSGWDELVTNLVKELHALDANLFIGQIKEKFGGLRAYIDTSVDDENIQAQFYALIEKAEELSYTICEECGEPGECRNELPWIATLCQEHYNARLDAIEKRNKEYDQRKAEANVKALKEAQDADNAKHERIYQELLPLLASSDVIAKPALEDLSWVKEFDDEDLRQLKGELLDALIVAKETNDTTLLRKLVKDWYITSVALEDTLRRSVLMGDLSE